MKPCIVSYLNKIQGLEDRTYLLKLIEYTVSPTVEGLKPASLMIFSRDSRRNLYENWIRNLDFLRRNLDLDFMELKRSENSVHVLFYDPNLLREVIVNKNTRTFLARFGYDLEEDISSVLESLSQRYSRACPHEIGVFLGYPVDDVLDFIYPSEKECLMKGYWKVYNDLERAKEVFDSYDRAKYKVYKEVCNSH